MPVQGLIPLARVSDYKEQPSTIISACPMKDMIPVNLMGKERKLRLDIRNFPVVLLLSNAILQTRYYKDNIRETNYDEVAALLRGTRHNYKTLPRPRSL